MTLTECGEGVECNAVVVARSGIVLQQQLDHRRVLALPFKQFQLQGPQTAPRSVEGAVDFVFQAVFHVFGGQLVAAKFERCVRERVMGLKRLLFCQ